MSNCSCPSITGQIPGRALYIGSAGQLYISRRYRIFRSIDWGATWHLDCYVPESGWKPQAAKIRLCARLLRYNIAAFHVLADGSRIAVARNGIYRVAKGDTRMTCVFPITRGSRPLNLMVDGNRVFFGEYGDGYESSEVFIYVSEDAGRTFDVGYRFPKGDIRHIHNMLVDPYRDHYWVLVGDFDRQPGFAALSKDLKTLEWLQRGSQKYRAVGAIVEPDCLIYGTDSDRERNFIMRIDKTDGKLTQLREVEGSSLYATRFGPIRLISTCVEPNPACTARECSLYASRDGIDWNRVVAYKKDKYHPVYFQFGAITLPYTYHAEPRGMYSGQAIQQVDDKVCLAEWM